MDSSSCDLCRLSSLLHSRSLSRGKSGSCNNTALLQMLVRSSAGRAGCGADLAACVLATGDFLLSQWASPLAFTPFEGLGLLPGAWGVPNKGNAVEAVGIFGKCRERVGSGPAPDPPEKGLLPHFHVRRGVEQIPQSRSQSRTQSQFCLSEPLPWAVIFLIVTLMRGFSQLSFMHVPFAFNIFLITYFCVVSSFEPPLDHNKKNVKNVKHKSFKNMLKNVFPKK